MAERLIKLDRGVDGVPIIDECLPRAANLVVNPRMIPSVVELNQRHFEKTKDASGCRATAETWEKLNGTDADSLYNAASFRAVTAAVLRATDQKERLDHLWLSHVLDPNPHRPLVERWLVIPVNVWHQAVVPNQNWAVVSFHTVPASELIEERPDPDPDPKNSQRLWQMKYIW